MKTRYAEIVDMRTMLLTALTVGAVGGAFAMATDAHAADTKGEPNRAYSVHLNPSPHSREHGLLARQFGVATMNARGERKNADHN